MKRIVRRTYARAGLLGNPSDGYHGKTISLIVGQLFAEVEFRESAEIAILPMPSERRSFASLPSLRDSVATCGYYGSERLILAALKKFYDFFGGTRLAGEPNFTVSATTNIPRSVGLAGSSAIVMATLRAALGWYGLALAPDVLASLTLAVEREELGIPAGLQDRVIQAYEGLVFMDFSLEGMRNEHGLAMGRYETLDPQLLPPLYVAYAIDQGEPTEVFHHDLRARFAAGEPAVVAGMKRFAELAELGRAALLRRDYRELHDLINANFDLRHSICRLNPAHRAMVEAARATGASAKFCGSGGAIIGTFDGAGMYRALADTLARQGCGILRPHVGFFQEG